LLDAAEFAGTRAGLTARQVGTLRPSSASRRPPRAGGGLPRCFGSALAALARTRLAGGLEAAGDPAAAAEAYLSAGQIEAFPGRIPALGDAARCFAQAGQNERALEVFAGLSEEEVARLPVYVTARMAELRILTSAAAPAAPAATPEAP
jgi:hypothetical protein